MEKYGTRASIEDLLEAGYSREGDFGISSLFAYTFPTIDESFVLIARVGSRQNCQNIVRRKTELLVSQKLTLHKKSQKV